ncbi:MAG: hypothetical protein HY974_01195 [Candidatus Kerfeldbacteria bacterium]|nr:hypothetical protein [Candidatus Kerfeldbacteria bacterium]
MAWLSFLWQRESWRAFLRRRGIIIPALLALGLVLLNWLLIFLAPPSPVQSFTLRYSIYFGPNWVVAPSSLVVLPVLSSLLVGLDLFLAYVVGRGTVILAHVWLWTGVAVALGLLWLSWLLVGFNS